MNWTLVITPIPDMSGFPVNVRVQLTGLEAFGAPERDAKSMLMLGWASRWGFKLR